MKQTTREWQQLDASHHLHPFTDFQALNKKGSRIITKAEGVYLEDSEGKRILDGMAGLWCVNMGYGRQELVDAATKQMQQLPYYNLFFQTSHPPAAELATLLAEITQRIGETLYPDNFGFVMMGENGDALLAKARDTWETVQSTIEGVVATIQSIIIEVTGEHRHNATPSGAL